MHDIIELSVMQTMVVLIKLFNENKHLNCLQISGRLPSSCVGRSETR